jgi:predicted ferric reductase
VYTNNMSETKKYGVLTLLIALTVAPLPFIVNHSDATFASWSAVALYISAILGYLGIVLLLWMYILGVRSVIGLYFTDLVRMRKLHAKLGKYGIVLIFAHPIAVALSYGQNILMYTFIPDLSTNFELYVTFGRLAFYAMLIVWVSSALLRGSIAYRPWKYIHHLAYIALPLSLLHIPIVGSSFMASPLAQFYYLSILGVYVLFSMLNYRGLFGVGKILYTVSSHSSVVDNVMVLHLSPTSDMHIGSKKGQFIYLQASLLGESHPFSILSYNEQSGDLYVGYKVFGRFTRKLQNLQIGSDVYIDGPYGTFTEQITSSTHDPTVFIAGGIGITPFVDHIMKGQTEQWLFYANQTSASTAFGDALQTKLGKRYVPILSNEQAPNTEHGYIRSDLFTKYLDTPTQYRYFICGPPKMMEITKRSLLGLGVPADKIFSEEFSF